MRRTIQERIDAKTVPGEGDCAIWVGCLSNTSTPVIRINHKSVSVRRYLWESSGKPVKKGRMFTNSCLEPRCINPDHIRALTKSDICKIHSSKGSRLRALNSAKTHRARSVINMNIAREIRCSSGTHRGIAEKFGISIHIVKDIIRNRTWKELTSPWAI